MRVVALDLHDAAVHSRVRCDRHETRSPDATGAKVIACRALSARRGTRASAVSRKRLSKYLFQCGRKLLPMQVRAMSDKAASQVGLSFCALQFIQGHTKIGAEFTTINF